MSAKKIVITGGPGTGKTSIIQKLKDLGFSCFDEISRAITLQARNEGTEWLFLKDPVLFSRLILEGRIAQFKNATNIQEEVVFLDRGLPDVVAYLDSIDHPKEAVFLDACRDYCYDRIFLLSPWKEIYTPDEGRYENYEEGAKVHEFLDRAYRNFGYDPIIVPKTTVDLRVKFILQNMHR